MRRVIGHCAWVRETRVVELVDGRELAWTEYGSPDGVPVVAFHESPGSRLFFAPQSPTAARGVCG